MKGDQGIIDSFMLWMNVLISDNSNVIAQWSKSAFLSAVYNNIYFADIFIGIGGS